MAKASSVGIALPPAGRQPWGGLALMFCLAIMSMVDRLILALMVKPLQHDLQLSHVQLGVLFGTAFALFYGVMGLPLATVADRFNRVRLVTIAVVFWSVCTTLSAFASSFGQLLVLRAGLALGEAALFPTCHSLIHDMFDARRRPLAASILTAAPPLGGALAFGAGGWIVGAAEVWTAGGGGFGFRPWQLAFLAVGIPSLVLGIAFALVVREPARHARVAAAVSDAVATLKGRRLMFALLLLAGGLCQVVPYAYQAWGPTLLTDGYHLSIQSAGAALGLVSVFGATSGSVLMPLLIVRRFDGGRAVALALFPLVAVIVGSVALGLAPLQGRLAIELGAILVGNFCFLGANSTVMVAMQRLAPDRLRATMIAGTLLVSSSLGLGVGPVVVAYLADAYGGFAAALALVAWIAGAIGSVLFALSGWRLASIEAPAAPAPSRSRRPF